MPKRILVVDDNALLRRSLAFHLEEAGYKVTTVATAEDALTFVREFNLLFTLAKEPGKVISVDDLLSRVWGEEFMGEPHVVYVHI